MCGMAGKLEAIRYSLRRYERMVKKLSEEKVCGKDNLYNRTEVRDFMEQYKEDRVDDSLLDLFGVEFGEVLEASSLLKAMMRAYCTTNPGKVQRFMEGIKNYALAGSLSHFAYTSLLCHKEGRQDCDENQDGRKEWIRKLYKFFKKANALKEAATNLGYGLQLDIQEDLDKLIYEEVKVANSRLQFDQLFSKVFDFIINKLNDINDWPEACMYNLDDKVVLVELAELLHNATEYDSDLRPWYLDFWNTGYGLIQIKFKLKEGNSKLYTKRYLTHELDNKSNVHCLSRVPTDSTWDYDCSVVFHNKPPENDWIISVLFNPNSYKIKAENPDNDQVTLVVFINRLPIYVYYTTKHKIDEKLGLERYLKVVRAQFEGDPGRYSQAAFLDPSQFGNSGP